MNIGHLRLLKLAKHLESGKLGHDNFSLMEIHAEKVPGVCGTVGCAMGEMPFVFPDQFEFAYLSDSYADLGCGIVKMKGGYMDGWWKDICEFFLITSKEQNHLFYHGKSGNGFDELPSDATPQHVAKHIRAFVERMSQD